MCQAPGANCCPGGVVRPLGWLPSNSRGLVGMSMGVEPPGTDERLHRDGLNRQLKRHTALVMGRVGIVTSNN